MSYFHAFNKSSSPPHSQLYDHLTTTIKQPVHSCLLQSLKQSYSIHSEDYNHDSQLPNSPLVSHPYGLRAGSNGASVRVLVHMPSACVNVCRAAAVFALCDPERPICRRSMTETDRCQCSTSLLNITRQRTVPYYMLYGVKKATFML